MLAENCLRYTENIDITNYVDGEKQSLNPSGRAHVASVNKFFKVWLLALHMELILITNLGRSISETKESTVIPRWFMEDVVYTSRVISLSY